MSDYRHLKVEIQDGIAVVTLDRAEKRNAVNDAMVLDLERFFSAVPDGVKAAVLTGAGPHFSAGLDLAEHASRSAFEGVRHSRMWHRSLNQIEFGGLPVVSAMIGGVIGGGLEIAASTHARVAEPSCFYALPEGRRGIFVGGGGSVRISRIIGADRMREMMLTGRRYDAAEGLRLGLSHYLVGEGEAMAKALELAHTIAGNAEMSNYLMIQALTRIADMSATDGMFTEALSTALTQTSKDSGEGMRAFLEKRDVKFKG
jgi:enoyl-CoA hydratase/carnithine racemase